jgi:protein-disulfide isomerase
VVVPPGTKAATDPSPSKGPAEAKVIFLEVSDFQCPVCKRSYEPLRQLADDFPGQVKLIFKHNALAMHRDAMNAAAASMAAARQNKFDAMADVLFENQRALGEEDLFRHAQQIGLDMNKFKKDYEDPTLRARIQAEGDMATELGAAGTPAFFVNGHMQVGWASYEAAKQMASREIAAVDALMAQGKSLKEARLERVKLNLPEYEKFLGSWLGQEHR